MRPLDKTWSPQAHPHVVGVYSERIPGDDQHYAVTCKRCGETWGPVKCDSGMVRRHIASFAIAHAHRDALKTPIEKMLKR